MVPWLGYIPMCIISGWLSDRLISVGVATSTVRKGSELVALVGTGLVLLCLPLVSEFYLSLFLVSLALALFSCHAGGHNANSQVDVLFHDTLGLRNVIFPTSFWRLTLYLAC